MSLIALTTEQDNWNIDADGFPQSDTSMTFLSGPFFLVDEAGNFLVDEAGNFLVGYHNMEGVYPIELSSEKDNFGLDA